MPPGLTIGLALLASASGIAQAGEPAAASLRPYYEHVSSTLEAQPPGHVSLAPLVASVLQFAGTRRDDPIEANRAALLALALHANGWDPRILAVDAGDWRRARRRPIALAGRPDLAQHFTVSAFVSAAGGAALADLLGVYKELRDAGGSSGFSFSDLAADRAGTRLGEMAVASPPAARRLQEAAGEGLDEADIMPAIDGLPDNLSAEVFARRFTGPASPAYDRLVAEIDRRVEALRLFGE